MSLLDLFLNRDKKKFLQSIKNNKKYDFVLEINKLNLLANEGTNQILKNINIKIPEFSVVAIIGPSGSGKSSLLRSINKTSFEEGNYEFTGEIKYRGFDVLNGKIPVEWLRTQIGTVLQRPVMFPMTIKANILFALKIHGIKNPEVLDEIMEQSLKEANLWDEVKDRLNSMPEDTLSIGQQQRLCIARSIALQPKILLMDEPTSALDPKSSLKIEELISKFSKNKLSTIIIVSHSLSQVRRISDYVIFIKDGVVVEQGRSKDMFTNPVKPETREFIFQKH